MVSTFILYFVLCSVLDLPYDVLNASFDDDIRPGPDFSSLTYYGGYYDSELDDNLNPASSDFTGLTVLPSLSGSFVSHRPNRDTYQTPYYCLRYNTTSLRDQVAKFQRREGPP